MTPTDSLPDSTHGLIRAVADTIARAEVAAGSISVHPSWVMDAIPEAVGAFLGASFAFLFLKLSELLRDRFDRERKHYTAIHRLQHVMTDTLAITWDNMYLIRTFQRSVVTGLTHWSFPRTLPADKSILLDLLNLTLVNELRGVHENVRKVNDDTDNAVAGYVAMRDLYLSGTMPHQGYLANMEEMVKVFEFSRQAQEELLKEVRRIIAWTRVLGRRDRTVGIRLVLAGLRSTDPSSEEIEKESALLEREMEQIQRASQERIERVFGLLHTSG